MKIKLPQDPAGRYRLARNTAFAVAMLASAAALAVAPPWPANPYRAGAPALNAGLASIESALSANLPAILSGEDRALYRRIFHAQKTGAWESADESISRLSNTLLLDHVMAERFLSRRYEGKVPDMVEWLAHNPDHSRAAEIHALAIAKQPSLQEALAAAPDVSYLPGSGDDSQDFTGPALLTWKEGINAWRSGDRFTAAALFSRLAAKPEELTTGALAAAAFWSYRAYDALGEKAEAGKYLRMAAAEPRCFYGILARKKLKESLGLDDTPLELKENDALAMIADPGIRRVIALAEIGRADLAEKELAHTFAQSETQEEKFALLGLAHALDYPALQISMAKGMGRGDGPRLDMARYPIPRWQPHGGFTVDPALIYALTRQESGFRHAATSRAGAQGLMQLMPATASMMQKRRAGSLEAPLQSLGMSEAEMNVTLGQEYIEHLLENPLVENNLFYLLAAYNAGPGRLQEWKTTLAANNDPLLFVESIPFAETRHYIMKVMTSYWIYSELAGLPSRSAVLVLGGRWPVYHYTAPVASAAARKAG